jgi:hypothetical protein
MSEAVPLELPIDAWVKEAQNDPVAYRSRCVTHILLAAIGLTPDLQDTMILKGGALMMLAFRSRRGTQDVDFTVTTNPEPFAGQLTEKLDPALLRAASHLGYLDLVCRVQMLKRLPKPGNFIEATGPALQVNIGYARRGTNEERRLSTKQASQILRVDLSFKEPITHSTQAHLERPDVTIQAYSPEDVIAEKMRALLQQPIRNRQRRQDVYDIGWLLDIHNPDDETKQLIFESLTSKAEARDLAFNVDSFDNPEVKRRASVGWKSLALEIDALPDFDKTFARIAAFYRSLPWTE